MSELYVLVDNCSKLVIKTSLTSLPSSGYNLITNITELDHCKDNSTLFVFEGLLNEPGYYSELEMYKNLFKLRIIFLHSSDNWVYQMRKIATCYQCDISLIDANVLQAALYQDESYIADAVDSDDVVFAKNLCKRSDTDHDKLRLANALLTSLDRERLLREQVQLLEEQFDVVSRQAAESKEISDLILKSYKEIIDKSRDLSDNLKQYEVIFSRPIYQKVNIHSYANKPFIIYFKEYQEFQEFDLFIKTLVEALRMQRRETVKVLRLFDNSSSRRVKTLPSYYKMIYNKMFVKDVNAEDFICKTGDYGRILDLLLINRVNVNVLIIIDSKDHNDTILSGSVLQYGVCKEGKHRTSFALNPENTITTDCPENELNWNVDDLEGKTAEEKFVYLSSTSAIRRVLRDIESFKNSV